jgi:hypothetical protein
MRKVKLIKLIPNAIPVIPIGTIFIVRREVKTGIFAIPYEDIHNAEITKREYFLYNHEIEEIKDD